jgi:hypothetical protein
MNKFSSSAGFNHKFGFTPEVFVMNQYQDVKIDCCIAPVKNEEERCKENNETIVSISTVYNDTTPEVVPNIVNPLLCDPSPGCVWSDPSDNTINTSQPEEKEGDSIPPPSTPKLVRSKSKMADIVWLIAKQHQFRKENVNGWNA